MAKLRNVAIMGRAFFIRLGNELSDMIRDETTIKGQDVRGKKFKPLKEPYRSRKGSGKLSRQAQTRDRAKLRLTGDMMDDLQTVNSGTTPEKLLIGWGEHSSQKLDGNAKRGRVVSTKRDPASKTVIAFAMGRINRQTKLNIKKSSSKTVIKL